MSAKAQGSTAGAHNNNSAHKCEVNKCAEKYSLLRNDYKFNCNQDAFRSRLTTQARALLQRLQRYNKHALSLCTLVLVTQGNFVYADDREETNPEDFTRTIYAGAGIGASRLEPNTNKIEGWDVNERVSSGGQINVGLDLYKQLSLELHSADLGSAGLSPSGRINYHIDGISALIYAGGNRDRYKRQGLTAYGRGGYGLLSNSPVGDVPFRTVDDNHWLWGAGLEYMHRNGFGARAEVISFSKDAQYGQLGMIYRFGQKSIDAKTTDKQAVAETDTNNQNSTLAPPPPPPPPPPAPPPIEPGKLTAQTTVTDDCSGLRGVMDGIRFDSGSAHLTTTARTILDDVAVTLSKCSQLPVIISAHTDSQGSKRTNQILSQRRAWAVINYLRGIGIDLYRLIPRAFGEDQPIDTNNTAEGRSNNRRVELIAR